ncbi:hypothetical protein QVN83_17090 [Yersinia frederiksenii]|nr:hypothetical protein [Yersinia frederiksenii]MDN0120678.1 hypothetical protein [Yersinia frederiksenii]
MQDTWDSIDDWFQV